MLWPPANQPSGKNVVLALPEVTLNVLTLYWPPVLPIIDSV